MVSFRGLVQWGAGAALAILLTGIAPAEAYTCRGEAPVGSGAMMMDLTVSESGEVTFSVLSYQARVGAKPPMLIIGYPVDSDRKADLGRPNYIQFIIWARLDPRPTAQKAQLRVNVNGAVLVKPWTKFSERLADLDAGKPPPPEGLMDWLALPDSAVDYFVKSDERNIALVAVGDDQSVLASGQYMVPSVEQLKPAAQLAIAKAYDAAKSPKTLCKPSVPQAPSS